MAKNRTTYRCTACGETTNRWMGRCPSCGEWNSLEELVEEADSPSKARSVDAPRAVRLSDASLEAPERLSSTFGEFDRVLGGGVVPGSVVLLGGDPGIGKSTLLLQVSTKWSRLGRSVLYVAGEESPGQIAMRASRLGVKDSELAVLAHHRAEGVVAALEADRPELAIIDSVQTLASERSAAAPGSVQQLREVTATITEAAKRLGVAVVLVGHVTRTGSIAGPRVVEHLVDTVLYLEGDPGSPLRVLRSVKNRFGSTLEVGLLSMGAQGLVDGELDTHRAPDGGKRRAPGISVGSLLEGTRAFVIEVQALVSTLAYGSPRLTCAGIDGNRVQMLAAILERHIGDSIAGTDVYVNIVSGLRLGDPTCDVAVALALASSARSRALPGGLWAVGELGLTGEVRSVPGLEARVGSALRAGYRELIVPHGVSLDITGGRLHPVRRLGEVFEIAFDGS